MLSGEMQRQGIQLKSENCGDFALLTTLGRTVEAWQTLVIQRERKPKQNL